jgi:4-amino-4-deoxy-L-arabinose transferase-like glycosyltransferase
MTPSPPFRDRLGSTCLGNLWLHAPEMKASPSSRMVTDPPQWLRIAVAALVVLVFAVQFFARDDGGAWWVDAAQYTMHAENLVAGRPYAEIGVITPAESMRPLAYPPGYPLLLAPIVAATGRDRAPIAALHALFLALSAGFVGALYWRRLAPVLVIALVLLTGFSPALSHQVNRGLSDRPFIAFVVLSLVLIERVCRSPSGRSAYGWAVAAGLVAGAALLTRSLGVALLPAFLVPVLWRREWVALRPVVVAVVVALALTATVYSLGDWEAGARIVEGERADAGYQSLVVHSFVEIASRIPERIADRIAQYAKEDGLLWSLPPGAYAHRAIHYPFRILGFVVLLVGAFVSLRRFRPAEAFAGFYLLALLPWSFGWSRYLLPALPVLTGILLVGVQALWRWARSRGRAARGTSGLALAAVSVLLVSHLYTGGSRMANRVFEGPTPPQADGSELVRAHTPPDATVVAARGDYLFAFKTGRTFAPVPRDTTDWGSYAQRIGAEYALWTEDLPSAPAWARRLGWLPVASNEAAILFRTSDSTLPASPATQR